MSSLSIGSSLRPLFFLQHTASLVSMWWYSFSQKPSSIKYVTGNIYLKFRLAISKDRNPHVCILTKARLTLSGYPGTGHTWTRLPCEVVEVHTIHEKLGHGCLLMRGSTYDVFSPCVEWTLIKMGSGELVVMALIFGPNRDSLVYIGSSRPARDTQRDLVSKIKQTKSRKQTKQDVENETARDGLFGGWAFLRFLWKFWIITCKCARTSLCCRLSGLRLCSVVWEQCSIIPLLRKSQK